MNVYRHRQPGDSEVADDRKAEVVRALTPEARGAAQALAGAARHGALATLEPGTGTPLCTRVGLTGDGAGGFLILVSALAAHTPALAADPRCSLLIGEIGKGDPLAHPRMTIQCTATAVAPSGDAHRAARARYLAAHPKAKLYVDLGDFRFFTLTPVSASFNAGFGRAYRLESADLVA